MLNFVDMLTHM